MHPVVFETLAAQTDKTDKVFPWSSRWRLYEDLRPLCDSLGIHVTRWAMGVAVGDYNGDGYDDLYITCYGPNILLRNECGRTTPRFTDVTAEAGVGDSRWGTSAAWGDIDGDSDLDLYVVNYLEFDTKHPPGREGSLIRLESSSGVKPHESNESFFLASDSSETRFCTAITRDLSPARMASMRVVK